jgi:beta-lactam-binding protein with PASTA domain
VIQAARNHLVVRHHLTTARKVAVLLVAGLAWWLWPRGVEVPAFAGQSLQVAEEKLTELGFKHAHVPKQGGSRPSFGHYS